MEMFTSYGHIKKPKQNHHFCMILAWDCPFKIDKLITCTYTSIRPRMEADVSLFQWWMWALTDCSIPC